MVDSYDHLAVDWENALRPAKTETKIDPQNLIHHLNMSLPPATSVFGKRNMTEDRERYVEVRGEAEIARASRSDTHSDWSTTLGANYTYRLYLQCPGCVVYPLCT